MAAADATPTVRNPVWAEPSREPLCVCDALGMCPAACDQCPACSKES